MVNRLIFANMITRPVRTVLSVMAVAIEVLLIIMVVGLTHGILEETARRTQGVGAEIMVQPQTTSLFMGFSGAPMPVQIAEKLEEIEGVRAVSPVMVQASTAGGVTLIYGIDPAGFDAVTGGFRFMQGHGLQSPDDVVVDDIYAESRNLKLGQTIELLNQQFHLSGIVEHGKGARIFLRLDRLQDLMGSVGKASVFFVKLTDPKRVSAVLEQMRGVLPNYQLRDMQEFVSLMVAGNVPGLGNFITVIISLAVAIGLLVIFVTMYSTMVERTREIGILKSIGASKMYVFRLVLRETALLTVLGIGAGIGMSYAVRAVVVWIFPTLPILITPDWMVRAGLVALVSSLAGACYPAIRASRRDPIEAL
ncbi:MAG: ABC transporter permease, partial [Acidobacteria bacterium]|nr:ABC transporter permease [Acidobacteriota bacterium]